MPIYNFDRNIIEVLTHDEQADPSFAESDKLTVLYKTDSIISCIATLDGTAFNLGDTVLIEGNRLYVCADNSLLCLELPNLELVWSTEVDWAPCINIYRLEDDFVIRGEVSISRIDKNGNIKWQFRGADIFVNLNDDDTPELEIKPDHLSLTDFNGTKYKVGFDGTLLWDNYGK
jgi:hypothetical protein